MLPMSSTGPLLIAVETAHPRAGIAASEASRPCKKPTAAIAAPPSSEHLIPLDFPSADAANPASTPPADQMPQTRQPESAAPDLAVPSHSVTLSRRPCAETSSSGPFWRASLRRQKSRFKLEIGVTLLRPGTTARDSSRL